MMSYPSPGGSGEPPSFSQADADAYCSRLELTLEPHTIAPAEVWQPTREQYRSVTQRYCDQHARIEQLTKQRNAANEMLAVVARERDEAVKDARWYRAAAVAGVALAVIARWL